jgi:hypothetical protein
MPIVKYKPFMLNVVMLSVVAPCYNLVPIY